MSWQPPLWGGRCSLPPLPDQLGFGPHGAAWGRGQGVCFPSTVPTQSATAVGRRSRRQVKAESPRGVPSWSSGPPAPAPAAPLERRPPRGPGCGWHPPSTLCFLSAAATRVACAQEGRAFRPPPPGCPGPQPGRPPPEFRAQSCPFIEGWGVECSPCVLEGSGRGRCWGAPGEEVLVLSLGVPGLDQSWSRFIGAQRPWLCCLWGGACAFLAGGAEGLLRGRSPHHGFPPGGGVFTQRTQPPGQRV